MVSHSVRPSGDDKCSDLRRSIKCFETIICAARARLSDSEIESYIKQAFDLESSPKRLEELSYRVGRTTRMVFCMTSFCASMCATFEAIVDFHLQTCAHTVPACGAKRTSYGNFVYSIRQETNPGFKLLSGEKQVNHVGSMTNCLLRFYRERAGLERQTNPVQILLQGQQLLGPSLNKSSKVEGHLKTPAIVQTGRQGVKREASPREQGATADKRVKRSVTDAPEARSTDKQLRASELRKELEHLMTAETGWLSRTQQLQSQLEQQETALRVKDEKPDDAQIENYEDNKDRATVKVLKTHVSKLQSDLAGEKKKIKQLATSLSSTGRERERLQEEVSRQAQKILQLEETNNKKCRSCSERVEDIEPKVRRSFRKPRSQRRKERDRR